MKKNRGSRAYRMRLAAWYPDEVTPGCIVTCELVFARNQKEAREAFIIDTLNRHEFSKWEKIVCYAIKRA